MSEDAKDKNSKDMEFSVIVAADQKGGIGKGGKLPWFIPVDMTHFRAITERVPAKQYRNAVIMGRSTWESIPNTHRPLLGRINIVVSRTMKLPVTPSPFSPHYIATSFQDALDWTSHLPLLHRVFAIGGAQLYAEALQHRGLASVYYTQVRGDHSCDTFFPALFYNTIEKNFHKEQIFTDIDTGLEFYCYSRQPSPADIKQVVQPAAAARLNPYEDQYLGLVNQILTTGVTRDDRTGVGTIGVFGAMMRFSLRNNEFPLLTTKTVHWRAIAEELLWMLRGCTDAKQLSQKNVKIWDANASRAFLDKAGFKDQEEGDLGPVYGFQWRHFGAQYVDCKTDYKGQGVDQIADIIQQIKTNPNSRRIILSAWNPIDLKKMALPPCHMSAQFFVANGELSCLMYQRSCDMGLGVPFNIAQYSLLTIMLAHVCNLKPGEFVHSMGDTHIYLNHVEALKEQRQRAPRPFPKLIIQRKGPALSDVAEFCFEDFVLQDYNPHPAIKMQMAV